MGATMRIKSVLLLGVCVLVGVSAGQDVRSRRVATTRPADDKPVRKPSKYRGPNVGIKVGPTAGEYLLTDRREGRQLLRTGGRTRRNAQTMTLAGDVVIHRADAGGRRKVDLTCQTVARTISVDDRSRSYDSVSSGPQDPILSAQWSPLSGWKGSRHVTAAGRSEKLTGIEALLLRLKPPPTDIQPPPAQTVTWVLAVLLAISVLVNVILLLF